MKFQKLVQFPSPDKEAPNLFGPLSEAILCH